MNLEPEYKGFLPWKVVCDGVICLSVHGSQRGCLCFGRHFVQVFRIKVPLTNVLFRVQHSRLIIGQTTCGQDIKVLLCSMMQSLLSTPVFYLACAMCGEIDSLLKHTHFLSWPQCISRLTQSKCLNVHPRNFSLNIFIF